MSAQVPQGEIVGLIPAAGHASRLQPLERSKEMLEVHGTPVMDFLVERMRAGGCTHLRVVTRPDKVDVISHCRELDADVVLGRPVTVSESFRAAVNGLAEDSIVLMGFPDTLWEPRDGFRLLVKAVIAGCDVALGLFRIDAAELPRSDVVVFDRWGSVTRIEVKPSVPRPDWIWGCAAARAGAMAGLARTEWPGGYFDLLCREGHDIRGVPLSDEWLDIGTPEAFADAERRFRAVH